MRVLFLPTVLASPLKAESREGEAEAGEAEVMLKHPQLCHMLPCQEKRASPLMSALNAQHKVRVFSAVFTFSVVGFCSCFCAKF